MKKFTTIELSKKDIGLLVAKKFNLDPSTLKIKVDYQESDCNNPRECQGMPLKVKVKGLKEECITPLDRFN